MAISSGTRLGPRLAKAGLLLVLVSLVLLVARATTHAAWLDAAFGALLGTLLLGIALAVLGFGSPRWNQAQVRAVRLRVILIVVSIALSVVAVELIARFAFWDIHSAADGRTYLAQRAPKARLNNVGYRDRDIGPKSADRYRIVVMGDSIAYGQGIEEPERFSDLIEAELGPGYEVFNFGMPSLDLPQYLDVLKQVRRHSPDFILLELYLNDFETARMVRPRPRALLPWPAADRAMLASSIVYGLLTTQYHRMQERSGRVESYPDYLERHLRDPDSEDSRIAFGMLREFFRSAAAAGIPTGVIIFPNPNQLGRDYPFEYLHNRIREVCIQEDVEYVELRQPFASMGDPRGLWVNRFDQHPNARAHRRAAEEALAKFKPVWLRRQPAPISAGGTAP